MVQKFFICMLFSLAVHHSFGMEEGEMRTDRELTNRANMILDINRISALANNEDWAKFIKDNLQRRLKAGSPKVLSGMGKRERANSLADTE